MSRGTYMFRFVMVWVFVCGFSVVFAEPRLSAKVLDDQGMAFSYVWATNGLKLRAAPSPESDIVTILPYGMQVELITSNEQLVPYQTLYLISQCSGGKDSIVLEGHWQKIKVADKEGYVFDQFLVNIEPINIDKEYIETYLRRVFQLTDQSKIQKNIQVEGTKWLETVILYKSKQGLASYKAISGTSHNGLDWPYEGGEAFIANLTFNQAIIFFNKIYPPFFVEAKEPPCFSYEREKNYSYAIDGVGNSADLKKVAGGISFNWLDAGD